MRSEPGVLFIYSSRSVMINSPESSSRLTTGSTGPVCLPSNGFEAGANGFEIPLYYLLMLVSLIITGPGKLSVDALIDKEKK